MRKIQDSGARVSQVPVRHLQRCYGRSQFFNFRRVFKVGVDLVALWFRLVLGRGARRRGVPPSPSSAGRRDLAG
jgi:hypothetical protein